MRLDKKCLIILEKLNESRGSLVTYPNLYQATKPTKYPTLKERTIELENAGLIEDNGEGRIAGYEITDFGKKVALTLKPEDELTKTEKMELKEYDRAKQLYGQCKVRIR